MRSRAVQHCMLITRIGMDNGPEKKGVTWDVLLCRLNYRLSIACHDMIMDKCADACTSTSIDQPCGGTVLRCLTEKLEAITDAECKKEVFYFIKMEVRRCHTAMLPHNVRHICTCLTH